MVVNFATMALLEIWTIVRWRGTLVIGCIDVRISNTCLVVMNWDDMYIESVCLQIRKALRFRKIPLKRCRRSVCSVEWIWSREMIQICWDKRRQDVHVSLKKYPYRNDIAMCMCKIMLLNDNRNGGSNLKRISRKW